MEEPGYVDGLVCVPLDGAGGWMSTLARNVDAAGIEMDWSALGEIDPNASLPWTHNMVPSGRLAAGSERRRRLAGTGVDGHGRGSDLWTRPLVPPVGFARSLSHVGGRDLPLTLQA